MKALEGGLNSSGKNSSLQSSGNNQLLKRSNTERSLNSSANSSAQKLHGSAYLNNMNSPSSIKQPSSISKLR
jgi:hypothetical protein